MSVPTASSPSMFVVHCDNLRKECSNKETIEFNPICCNCTLVGGEKPHPGPYRVCCHGKGEPQRRAQRGPNVTLPEESFAAELCHCKENQKPQAPQTLEKSLRPRASADVTTGNPENGCQ
jgi:hypothetical protein